uniref:Uncharacterized protein n=1 Tax=Laticauda laticaudata TaxID=8630 RepID=A0A8C5SXK2_LATLA
LCHGPPKMDRSWQRALTKHDPLEKKMATHSRIFAMKSPWTVPKDIYLNHSEHTFVEE